SLLSIEGEDVLSTQSGPDGSLEVELLGPKESFEFRARLERARPDGEGEVTLRAPSIVGATREVVYLAAAPAAGLRARPSGAHRAPRVAAAARREAAGLPPLQGARARRARHDRGRDDPPARARGSRRAARDRRLGPLAPRARPPPNRRRGSLRGASHRAVGLP